MLPVAAVVLLGSCAGLVFDDLYGDREKYPGYNPGDEPESGFRKMEIQSRLHGDVRKRRLRENLDLGLDSCFGIRFDDEGPMCCKHEIEIQVFTFPYESEEGKRAIREKTYFCPEGLEYWYRWRKLEPEQEKWFGPFPSRLRRQDQE
jgi:hypothetical protein